MNQDIIYCAKCGGRLAEDTGFCANCASPDKKPLNNDETKIIAANSNTTAGTGINTVSAGRYNAAVNARTAGTGDAVGDPRYNAAVATRAAIIRKEDRDHAAGTAVAGGGNAAGVKSAAVEKPKGLKAKFKALPRETKIALICVIVLFAILIIIGIVILVNNALSLSPIPERPVAEDPVDPVPGGVQSVRLMRDGVRFTDGEIEVGESIILRVAVEPEDIDEEVIWTNHNTAVIEVTYNNEKRTDVTVTGTGRGLVRLTAKVGGVEAVSVFRVVDGPPPDAESVTITSEGEPVSKSDIFVGDSLTLHILVEPEGVVDEIIFTSSNPAILEAVTSSFNSNEIIVKGISEGNAILTVSVGEISVECAFNVEIMYIEVPHPYVAAVQEFFRGTFVSTAAYISEVPGAEEPVVLAVRLINDHEAAYRILYMRDGNLNMLDINGISWPSSRVAFSGNNHLVTATDDDALWFGVHIFDGGELKQNNTRLWTLYPPHFDGYWHNDRQVTEAEFNALLGVYGLNTNNTWPDRPDDTARIHTMTIMVPRPN